MIQFDVGILQAAYSQSIKDYTVVLLYTCKSFFP